MAKDLERVRKFIERHYRKTLTIESLADLAGRGSGGSHTEETEETERKSTVYC